MSTIRAALGGGHVWEHGGKTYDVRHVGQDDKSALQAWLEGRARQSVVAMKGDVPDDVYREALGQVNADIAAGVYSFHGPVAARAVGTLQGMCGLAAILFVERKTRCRPSVAEMEEMALSRGDELFPFLEMVFKESARPNSKAPAPSQGPAEADPQTTAG